MNREQRADIEKMLNQVDIKNGMVRRIGSGWKLQFTGDDVWHKIPAPKPIINMSHCGSGAAIIEGTIIRRV